LCFFSPFATTSLETALVTSTCGSPTRQQKGDLGRTREWDINVWAWRVNRSWRCWARGGSSLTPVEAMTVQSSTQQTANVNDFGLKFLAKSFNNSSIGLKWLNMNWRWFAVLQNLFKCHSGEVNSLRDKAPKFCQIHGFISETAVLNYVSFYNVWHQLY
jgi:hypothetical protein